MPGDFYLIQRVKTPASRGGVSSGGVDSLPESPIFQLAETSSLALASETLKRLDDVDVLISVNIFQFNIMEIFEFFGIIRYNTNDNDNHYTC